MRIALYSLAILLDVLSTRGGGGDGHSITGSDDYTKQNLRDNVVVRNETRSVISDYSGMFLKRESAIYEYLADNLRIAANLWNTRILRNNADSARAVKNFPKIGERSADQNEVARTFGIRRRLQMFLFLPISFKLGVILTLLLVLTAISAKTLLLGFVVLLLLAHNMRYGHSKWLGVSRSPPELLHEQSHKSVHIHVHNVIPESHSPLYYRQDSWHDSSQPLTNNIQYEHA